MEKSPDNEKINDYNDYFVEQRMENDIIEEACEGQHVGHTKPNIIELTQQIIRSPIVTSVDRFVSPRDELINRFGWMGE